MVGGYFEQAGIFLINTVFWLYILAVLLRFLLQWVRADFYNPISHFLVTITNPPLKPLRRIIPGLWGLDLASLLLLLVLEVVKFYLLALTIGAGIPHPLGVLFLSLGDLVNMTINIYIFVLIVLAVLSWVAPHVYNPAVSLLISLSDPMVRPLRRLIPPVGGLDLSFIVAFVLLYLARILIVGPLLQIGFAYAGIPLLAAGGTLF